MNFDSFTWAFAFANIVLPLSLLALGYRAKRLSEIYDLDIKR